MILVSDTYLSAAELRDLITASAGAEVMELIDRVFVSSEAGFSKAEGLLGHALKAMKLRAHQTLHIGDNRKADYEGARALGIPALHLVQFEEAAKQRLRLERACAQLAGQGSAALEGFQPHRAALAFEEPQIEDPAERLGFAVLGPVFAAYEHWLRREAETLAQEHGGTVHWLFMMRDGHLPQVVHQAFGAAPNTASHRDQPVYRHRGLAHLAPESMMNWSRLNSGSIRALWRGSSSSMKTRSSALSAIRAMIRNLSMQACTCLKSSKAASARRRQCAARASLLKAWSRMSAPIVT